MVFCALLPLFLLLPMPGTPCLLILNSYLFSGLSSGIVFSQPSSWSYQPGLRIHLLCSFGVLVKPYVISSCLVRKCYADASMDWLDSKFLKGRTSHPWEETWCLSQSRWTGNASWSDCWTLCSRSKISVGWGLLEVSWLRLCLTRQGLPVQILVGKLRSHIPYGQKTKIEKWKQYHKFNKYFLNSPLKKIFKNTPQNHNIGSASESPHQTVPSKSHSHRVR